MKRDLAFDKCPNSQLLFIDGESVEDNNAALAENKITWRFKIGWFY